MRTVKLLGIGALAALALAASTPTYDKSPTVSIVPEDSPYFQCWNNGNKVCGHPGEYLHGTQLWINLPD